MTTLGDKANEDISDVIFKGKFPRQPLPVSSNKFITSF